MFDDNENLESNENLSNETDNSKEITNDLLGEFADLLADVEAEQQQTSSKEQPKVEPKIQAEEENQISDSEPVTVQPVQFAAFDVNTQTSGEENQNLDLLMDVKLQLTVELGRCELPIKKVLELTRGSIVELDKVAGEPVALYANGKHVANGEVVVIDDNFGLRITNISDPEERMKGLQ